MRHRGNTQPWVALTQISAYSTHKTLAVRKIMEVMRAAYAKSGIRSPHASEGAQVLCEREARIVCEQLFSVSLNRLMVVKVLLKCPIRFSISLVRISEFPFANFSSTCKRCTHLLKS